MNDKKAWWKEAVVYQIYPRSFADSNGDGIGDLNGITQHLPYLADLGIDVIWLSPVYMSPNDDNGYDVSDYRDIMPEFGTMKDFDNMLATAHELGIKIVMDLVVNHTSDEHEWFLRSRSSKDDPYRDYYIWKDGKGSYPPTNWQSVFSGSAWEYDDLTGQYYLHCFTKKQPDLNWANKKVRESVYEMMTWWCEKGIDGFRLDAINMISKDPSFPEGPVTDGLYGELMPYVAQGPHVHEYLREMNRKVLSKYDIMTVGEADGLSIEEAVKYAGNDGSELGMMFHFEHVSKGATTTPVFGKWDHDHPDLTKLRNILNKWQTGLEGRAWGSLYWDNHDQPRAVSRFGNDSRQYRVLSAKMLATLLHMMKGTPYIYQGEELGMTNMTFSSISDCRDVEQINAYRQYVTKHGMISSEELLKCFSAMGRDNARTPMQWDNSMNGGFSTAAPWIGVNPNYTEINAASQINDPDSVYSYYKKLIRLRHENEIIVYGKFRPLLEDSDCIYAYERILDDDVLTVACNWTENNVKCSLFDCTSGRELISNYDDHTPGILKPYEARVYLTRLATTTNRSASFS
ncbi:MAG: alpha-glucosidase [Lachnospiraceae bacterium]|nr:alpha-glucosidase [Lachnospiraceae bacterium]